MKIGFDAKRAIQNYTGLGNYSRYVLRIISQSYAQNEYILYAPKRRKNLQLGQLLSQYPFIRMAYPVQSLWKKLSSIWRIWGITNQLEKDKIEVFHGLSNELPLNIRNSNIKSIVTIHDLIFLHYPQYYKPIDRKIYSYKFRKACINADKVIAVSECTKRDIVRFYNIPENKIEVIYQGCDIAFSKVESTEKKSSVRDKYKLPEQYILNVGSIEDRKNVLLAVETLPQLPENIHLVIIGKRTTYTNKVDAFIKEHKLEDRVHIYSNVPFDDLPAIYQLAEIFVYPSKYEGFGIPILEALHSGIPVVGATGSCLEEAGGPKSLYVRPDDVNGLAQAFLSILSSPQTKQEMITYGKEYAKRFSEEKQAEQIINMYEELTGKKS